MGEKERRLKAKVVHKHELEKDWNNSNYVPAIGEVVFYAPEITENGDPDASKAIPGRDPITYTRQKNGDGIHKVKELPFDTAIQNLADGEGKNSIVQKISDTTEEQNLALDRNAVAFGSNAIAGSKGYFFNTIDFRPHQSDETTYEYLKIRLTATQPQGYSETVEESLTDDLADTNFESGWSVYDIINVSNYTKHDAAFLIVGINHDIIELKAIIDKYNALAKTGSARNNAKFVSKLKADVPFSGVDNRVTAANIDFDDYFVLNIDKPDVGSALYAPDAFVHGTESKAIARSSYAEGKENKAIGHYSHVEGRKSVAGYYSHAEGYQTIAIGQGTHSEGHQTQAFGSKGVHAEGFQTIANGLNGTHAEGNKSKATGEAAHAEGSATEASNRASHSEGLETHATGEASHAEGRETIASAEVSHAEGKSTEATAPYTHAEGNSSKAIKIAAHAEGRLTTASGDASHSEGANTTSSGDFSHAEGSGSEATNRATHAEGLGTKATGDAAHAEGAGTLAAGGYSHAGGYNTQANGSFAFAHGSSVIAGEGQSVFGEHNDQNDEALAQWGNGTQAQPSNAFEILKNGNFKYKDTSNFKLGYTTINSVFNAAYSKINTVNTTLTTNLNNAKKELTSTITKNNDYLVKNLNNLLANDYSQGRTIYNLPCVYYNSDKLMRLKTLKNTEDSVMPKIYNFSGNLIPRQLAKYGATKTINGITFEQYPNGGIYVHGTVPELGNEKIQYLLITDSSLTGELDFLKQSLYDSFLDGREYFISTNCAENVYEVDGQHREIVNLQVNVRRYNTNTNYPTYNNTSNCSSFTLRNNGTDKQDIVTTIMLQINSSQSGKELDFVLYPTITREEPSSVLNGYYEGSVDEVPYNSFWALYPNGMLCCEQENIGDYAAIDFYYKKSMIGDTPVEFVYEMPPFEEIKADTLYFVIG